MEYLISAGKSSPRNTHGTGPRPIVNVNVKIKRQATGSQDPAALKGQRQFQKMDLEFIKAYLNYDGFWFMRF